MKGDFTSPAFAYGDDVGAATRAAGTLSADGSEMTDLWVFDFMDGVCMQSLHQDDATVDDWGRPVMQLKYGEHHIYFVASCGREYTLDESANTIVWSRVRDTFWKDYSVTVSKTSNGNRAVALDRMATKLRLTITDETPSGAATVNITPGVWYSGLNYVTGSVVGELRNNTTVVNIPASYIGTAPLSVSLYGLSPATEWSTDVTVDVKNADGESLGSASMADVPLKANRCTEYSGALFGAANGFSLSLNDTWDEPYAGTW